MYKTLFVAFLSLAVAACMSEAKVAGGGHSHDGHDHGHDHAGHDHAGHDHGTAPKDKPAAQPGKLDAAQYDLFGEGVTAGAAVPVATVLAEPAAHVGKTIRMEGDIQAVCKKKGCWMTMAGADRNVRVTFKGYSFFVPLDSDGRHAVVEGVLTQKEQSVADTKHYLEDEGKHEEAAKVTEPQQVFSFEATGVALKK